MSPHQCLPAEFSILVASLVFDSWRFSGVGEQDPTPSPTQNVPIAGGILCQRQVLTAAFLFSAPSHRSPAGWHCQ